jgi:hypothetical protein
LPTSEEQEFLYPRMEALEFLYPRMEALEFPTRVRKCLRVTIVISLTNNLVSNGHGEEGSSDPDLSTRNDHLLVMTPTKTTDILLRHVRVNAIADYYDIPQLRELANSKIRDILKTNWSADSFSSVVKAVFNSTSDVELRDIMALTATSHMETLIELEDFAALEVMGDFAVKLVRNMIAKHKVEEEKFREAVGIIQHQLEETEDRCQAAVQSFDEEKSLHQRDSARTERMVKIINSCHETLLSTKECRNTSCQAEFMCYIETGDSFNEPKYTLRCAKCRCRHYDA